VKNDTKTPPGTNGEPVSAVLFDMDNTLFDFVHAQLVACRAVLDHLGLPDSEEDLFMYFRRPVHGFEHHNNIRDFLVDRDAFSVRLFAECCSVYETEKITSIEPYSGMEDVLVQAKERGLLLAIITDATSANAERRLKHSGLQRFFSAIISPDTSGAAKPDPASFLLATRTLCTAPEETVLVGDSIRRDIEPARTLRMTTVYAQYGDRYAADRNSACIPDFTARKVPDLTPIFDHILTSRNGT
jgi:putative hydrolase of the HAD superfamily